MTEQGALRRLLRKIRSTLWRLRQALLSQRFGVSPTRLYDDGFFDGPGCKQGLVHSESVATILNQLFQPRSIFDVGCGQGALITEFAKLGVEAFGCDGSKAGVKRCSPSVFAFQADLKHPMVLNRRFDLVSCIEVAEHLPRRAGPVLVRSIVDAAERLIVFSAAISGSGEDHINLRPAEYWASLFEELSFAYLEEETGTFRTATKNAGAPEWFQNVMIFQRSDCRFG